MSSPQKTVICLYHYDPLDRLSSHNPSGTPERHRFYCKRRLATEVKGANEYSIVQYDDWLLAQQQRVNGGLDTTLLATDLQRSVLQTLKSNQHQPIAYSPYGHRHTENGLTSLLGFNGERPDAMTGHYLLGNGHRAFNPVLMRFNSSDNFSPFGKGGLNSYMYCSGDPLNLVDPSGRVSRHVFSKRTRTLTISNPSNSVDWNLNPETSNKAAKRIVKKMNRIDKKMRQKDQDIKAIVERDKQNNHVPLTNSKQELQTRTANAINADNRIDTSQLPNPLREFVSSVKAQNETARDFYSFVDDGQSGYAMGSTISALANGHTSYFLSAPAPATFEFARQYVKRIATIRESSEVLHAKQMDLLISKFHWR